MERKLNIPDGANHSEVVVFGPAALCYGGGIAALLCGGEAAASSLTDPMAPYDRAAATDGAADSAGPRDGDGSVEIVMGIGARLDLVLVILPGVSPDITLSVRMDGEDSVAEISGLYLCPDNERVNIRLNVIHNLPHCTSHQLLRGIVSGHALTSFHGLIRVAQDAQKTEAFQENHNLLLSDTAQARTMPQLEIYADDVKCSHGATVGRLDEEEQFYMRSRGISAEDARRLQMVSFLSPVVSRISDQTLRAEVMEQVTASLDAFSDVK